ncbi:MAG: hypothetical protein ACVCEJ_03480 [Candidatus Izemoplasmataceae bacterium]
MIGWFYIVNGGKGQHRIEGIGDKMCTLIHNVLNTDFIALIKDDDAVRGLKVVHDGVDILVKHGVDKEIAKQMKDLFGVSGIANIIGAIKMAKYLKLGPDDNVVTIATDGFDRYDSVLEDLERRYLETEDFVLDRWFKDVYRKNGVDDIVDYRSASQKEKLFKQKEKDWLKFGYKQAYLDSMRHMDFWTHEYEKVHYYDDQIKKLRKES